MCSSDLPGPLNNSTQKGNGRTAQSSICSRVGAEKGEDWEQQTGLALWEEGAYRARAACWGEVNERRGTPCAPGLLQPVPPGLQGRTGAPHHHHPDSAPPGASSGPGGAVPVGRSRSTPRAGPRAEADGTAEARYGVWRRRSAHQPPGTRSRTLEPAQPLGAPSAPRPPGHPPSSSYRGAPPPSAPTAGGDRKSTRLNSSHRIASRMPSSA